MDKLNDDCLELILERVKSLRDLKNVCLVCKKWKEIGYKCKLWRRVPVSMTVSWITPSCSILASLAERRITQLRVLTVDVRVFQNTATAFLHHMAQQLSKVLQNLSSSLRVLDLNSCSLDDQQLEAVFNVEMPGLEHLIMPSHCSYASLGSISRFCPKLQKLVTNAEMPAYMIEVIGRNLPDLREMTTRSTPYYDDENVSRFPRYMPNLEQIKLRCIEHLSTDGLAPLAQMHSLRSLCLCCVKGFSEDFIRFFADSPLRKLSLFRCKDVNSDGMLIAIGRYRVPLEMVELEGGQLVTINGIEGLLRNTPNPIRILSGFSTYYIQRDNAVRELLEQHCPQWEKKYPDSKMSLWF